MLLSLLYVLLSGIALPVGGIQMQYLWRNQLGDVYSLGLGSAACLGAATATMCLLHCKADSYPLRESLNGIFQNKLLPAT